jgi:hypothetical protein
LSSASQPDDPWIPNTVSFEFSTQIEAHRCFVQSIFGAWSLPNTVTFEFSKPTR